MFLVPHRQAKQKFQQEQFIFTNENRDLAWASKGDLGGGASHCTSLVEAQLYNLMSLL